MKISQPKLRVLDPKFVAPRATKTDPVLVSGTNLSDILNRELGRALWRELHLRAIDIEGNDDSAWIDAYTKRIPCGQCRQHWMASIDRSEVDWNNYFQWTVDRHNEINVSLGKPVMNFSKEEYLAAHAR